MMSDDLVIDAAAIERLREWGGDKLVRQMIRLYLENAAVRLGQIDEGLAAGGDLERTEQGAHSLKSSAANVGAVRVRRLAAELEARAEERDLEQATGLRERLQLALTEAEEALTALAQGLGA
jgi:HPt (histidine-containing phosphotransfer) domain-containing protein